MSWPQPWRWLRSTRQGRDEQGGKEEARGGGHSSPAPAWSVNALVWSIDLAFSDGHDPVHGFEATREAAMQRTSARTDAMIARLQRGQAVTMPGRQVGQRKVARPKPPPYPKPPRPPPEPPRPQPGALNAAAHRASSSPRRSSDRSPATAGHPSFAPPPVRSSSVVPSRSPFSVRRGYDQSSEKPRVAGQPNSALTPPTGEPASGFFRAPGRGRRRGNFKATT
jgi:hypothetical protein